MSRSIYIMHECLKVNLPDPRDPINSKTFSFTIAAANTDVKARSVLATEWF